MNLFCPVGNEAGIVQFAAGCCVCLFKPLIMVSLQPTKLCGEPFLCLILIHITTQIFAAVARCACGNVSWDFEYATVCEVIYFYLVVGGA